MWSATWMQMMQWWETRWKGRTCCWCNCWYLLISVDICWYTIMM
jgi:hypothetical protein